MSPWEYVAIIAAAAAVVMAALFIVALGCIDDLADQIARERAIDAAHDQESA